jgi:hypothetical protein
LLSLPRHLTSPARASLDGRHLRVGPARLHSRLPRCVCPRALRRPARWYPSPLSPPPPHRSPLPISHPAMAAACTLRVPCNSSHYNAEACLREAECVPPQQCVQLHPCPVCTAAIKVALPESAPSPIVSIVSNLKLPLYPLYRTSSSHCHPLLSQRVPSFTGFLLLPVASSSVEFPTTFMFAACSSPGCHPPVRAHNRLCRQGPLHRLSPTAGHVLPGPAVQLPVPLVRSPRALCVSPIACTLLLLIYFLFCVKICHFQYFSILSIIL